MKCLESYHLLMSEIENNEYQYSEAKKITEKGIFKG
jgi:hypothetical protein